MILSTPALSEDFHGVQMGYSCLPQLLGSKTLQLKTQKNNSNMRFMDLWRVQLTSQVSCCLESKRMRIASNSALFWWNWKPQKKTILQRWLIYLTVWPSQFQRLTTFYYIARRVYPLFAWLKTCIMIRSMTSLGSETKFLLWPLLTDSAHLSKFRIHLLVNLWKAILSWSLNNCVSITNNLLRFHSKRLRRWHLFSVKDLALTKFHSKAKNLCNLFLQETLLERLRPKSRK